MVGKKSVIETGVDKLVKLITEYKKISVKDAAKELGVSVSSVEEWADFLEEEGIISIQSHFATVYLVERKIGKKELQEKVKVVRDEKENFIRKVESSINALSRDREEIKLIDSEFKHIKRILEDNFSKLNKQLGSLEDFRKGHKGLEAKKREIEDEYEGKINELESRLKKDQKRYTETFQAVEGEIDAIKKEREHLEVLQESENKLRSKVSEIDKLISHVRKEIDKGNEQIELDEERLDRSEKHAKEIRDELNTSAKGLVEMSKQVSISRKELEKMERDMLKDIENLSRGDLDKIGSYKESKQVIDKFKKFFSQANGVESLIEKAEKEEDELKEHFENLVKKVHAFSVVTSIPDIKKDMNSLKKELAEIESKKSTLGTQLRKLRTVVRAVVK
ncbi:hypothetical protein ACFL3V_02190 [Nanoarchaeota archaeon]